ncbi:DUF4347 domain-containing protein [Pseudoroseomonas cervicalis]|uniref:DUF4347 domain-containing protein n=1 Tax=Teichococcus cervicalis TaxID=204525 RepID=UPI0022F1B583|nr:DUF4347 domain-containing protein [Pseudoroseomonas cervicalis]WBV41368.1 DUF4347 domain-containing protein [Pseudoroseomonas cervicalis]
MTQNVSLGQPSRAAAPLLAGWPALERVARSLLVLDPRAPGWTLRLAAAGEEEAVLLLDPARDGLLHLAEVAAERAPLLALRVCGGGEAGRLLLGSAVLEEGGLEARGWVLAALGRSLHPRAVIRLEGAAAEGAPGARLMAALAHRTGRDVLAEEAGRRRAPPAAFHRPAG